MFAKKSIFFLLLENTKQFLFLFPFVNQLNNRCIFGQLSQINSLFAFIVSNINIGLPVPNVEALYIGPDGVLNSGDESLVASAHAMPGMTAPYLGNTPHVAEEFYVDKPFWSSFPFGYVAENLNWFEAGGVPFAAYDDFSRENPYPLVRVQANVGGNIVATTDTVLPISGEASCKNCHSADVTDTHPRDIKG